MDKLEFQGTAEGWKFTSDGEANFYGIKTGKNWLMRIQQNGELMPAKQMANMQLILASQKMIKALQYVAKRLDEIDAWWIDDETRGINGNIIQSAIKAAIDPNQEPICTTLVENIEFEGVEPEDHPDYANAYIQRAEHAGKEMTEDQLEKLQDDHPGFVYEKLMDHLT